MSESQEPSPLEPLFEAIDESAAILASGRDLADLTVNGETIQTLLEAMRLELYARQATALITYSLAAGLQVETTRLEDEEDRRRAERVLEPFGLSAKREGAGELDAASVMRSVARLLRTRPKQTWADGRPLRFAILIRHSEDIFPTGVPKPSMTDEQLAAAEVAIDLAQSLAARQSGNLIICHGRANLVDESVRRALREVHLPQPTHEEKVSFIGAAQKIYIRASLDKGLTFDDVARLTRRTPNRGIETLQRRSHRRREPITTRQIASQRVRDIEQISPNHPETNFSFVALWDFC